MVISVVVLMVVKGDVVVSMIEWWCGSYYVESDGWGGS